VDAAHTVPESNESNNQFGRIVTFNSIPDLQVVLVPIDYTHQGPANPGFYPGQGIDNISDWVRRAYPIDNVNVTIRTPHDFSGNLQDNSGAAWVTLLDQIFTLKIGDGLAEDTPVVYYGLIPVNNGSTQWFTSGIAGIGWISPPGQNFREALGLNLGANDETGILAGHEIGHNLGRQHAPCGNPASPDSLYPYSGASIGEYGTDIRGNTVSLNTPTSHVDVMSYCSLEWVSDYTYTALYNNQRTQGLSQPAETGERLIIRATFTGNNEITLAPSYAFPIKSSNELAASEVMVELLGANGEIIAAYPVNVRKVEEEGITFRSVMGTVPLPDVPAASLRLVEDGVVLAERQFEQPARLGQAALAVTQTAETVMLNWGLPDLPALVRYTADNGQSWTTLAVDALGGSFSTDITGWMGESGRFEIILANTGAVTTLTADWPAQ
jgi:hypothetical protein